MPPQINEKPPQKRGLTGAPLTTQMARYNSLITSLFTQVLIHVLAPSAFCPILTSAFQVCGLILSDVFFLQSLHIWKCFKITTLSD